MVLKFEYDISFRNAFMTGIDCDDPADSRLLSIGIDKSIEFSKSPEYVQRFEGYQDNYASQVMMYEGLCAELCDFVTADEPTSEVIAHNDEALTQMIRSAYTFLAATEYVAVPIQGQQVPLLGAYLFERGNSEVFGNLNPALKIRYIDEFFSMMQVENEGLQSYMTQHVLRTNSQNN